MASRDRIWVVMLRQPRPDDWRREVEIQAEVERAEADGYEFCTATDSAIIMVRHEVTGLRLCLHEEITVDSTGAMTCELCGAKGPGIAP